MFWYILCVSTDQTGPTKNTQTGRIDSHIYIFQTCVWCSEMTDLTLYTELWIARIEEKTCVILYARDTKWVKYG